MSVIGTTGTPALDVTSSSGFQSQSLFCLIPFFAEAKVMYIAQDPCLVLHMLTSWQPAHSWSLPHMHVQEVALGSDSNGQSPGQKANTLPLCQIIFY